PRPAYGRRAARARVLGGAHRRPARPRRRAVAAMQALADAYERQQRARDALHLCPEATPVLFFGEIARARIVTAAINPSAREFVARDGAPLARPRLLHDRARSGSAPADAERALEMMRSYFDPARDVVYWDWFRPVEHLLNALGASLVD